MTQLSSTKIESRLSAWTVAILKRDLMSFLFWCAPPGKEHRAHFFTP